MPTPRSIAADLRAAVERALPVLATLDESTSARASSPGKWCAKEVLGHLVDSASNNHQRFVRARFQEDLVFPGYEQDAWIAAQDYRAASWRELVDLWRAFNLHLARVIELVPADVAGRRHARHNLDRIAYRTVPAGEPATLAYFMDDYVAHLRHHLAEIECLAASAASATDEARRRASTTYDAAADTYDHAANSFWERFGRATVEGLGPAPGARVLDVCCGSGASALAAAERVGPRGSVLGVDLAENLLALAREKARRRALANVEFRKGDLLALDPLGTFDAVVCVFGVFFVPDMGAAVRSLWRRVRPGGRLALTTWGPRLFEPVNSVFWNAVRELRPELHRSFNPWDRISEPEAVRALLAEGGVESTPEIHAESARHALSSPDDWWALVLGSGYRGTVEQLSKDASESVRAACAAFIEAEDVREVETNVVYALATRPA